MDCSCVAIFFNSGGPLGAAGAGGAQVEALLFHLGQNVAPCKHVAPQLIRHGAVALGKIADRTMNQDAFFGPGQHGPADEMSQRLVEQQLHFLGLPGLRIQLLLQLMLTTHAILAALTLDRGGCYQVGIRTLAIGVGGVDADRGGDFGSRRRAAGIAQNRDRPCGSVLRHGGHQVGRRHQRRRARRPGRPGVGAIGAPAVACAQYLRKAVPLRGIEPGVLRRCKDALVKALDRQDIVGEQNAWRAAECAESLDPLVAGDERQRHQTVRHEPRHACAGEHSAECDRLVARLVERIFLGTIPGLGHHPDCPLDRFDIRQAAPLALDHEWRAAAQRHDDIGFELEPPLAVDDRQAVKGIAMTVGQCRSQLRPDRILALVGIE